MRQPLVTVICLCYNHEQWIEEAVLSVVHQTYRNIEIILVDDSSTDISRDKIRGLKEQHPNIITLLLPEQLGNCKAFNKGYKLSRGEFIIDFATDDVMEPDRITKQVVKFNSLDKTYGIVFTDARYINENGDFIRDHYAHLFRKKLIRNIPQGDVYRDVLSRYFIASPTMMVRREVFEKIDGYDEALSYEDFDFWVRSSRLFKYSFLNERLTRIRRSSRSMSTGWYKKEDKQLYSTYLVCKKAIGLNRDERDKAALLARVRYELRQSVFSDNRTEARLFYELLEQLKNVRWLDRFFHILGKLPFRWGRLRSYYHRLRYGV